MLRKFGVVGLLIASFAVAADNAEVPKATAPPEPEGMVALVKGDSLTGWDGDARLWSAKDGVIRGETTKENPAKGNTFLVWKGGTLGDFDLRLSFRIKNGNAGIQYRSKLLPPKEGEQNRWIVSGYQAEVEDTPGKVGFLYHERGPGRGYPDRKNYLCQVGDKVTIDETGKSNVVGKLGDKDAIGKTYKKSDWNDYVIIARGVHLRHYLNGIQTVDVFDEDPKNTTGSGILALQIHAGPPMVVEYKDVRLKQYDAKP